MKQPLSAIDRAKIRVNILGVGASPITMADAIMIIEHWIQNRTKNYICVMPAHSVMDCLEDKAVRRVFNNSGMTTPDGMAIVWLLKLHGYHFVERVYGPDLMVAMLKETQSTRRRHFLLGGTEEVQVKLQEKIHSLFPNSLISGNYSPTFGPITQLENEKIIQEVNKANADILWVGLGSPKQEKWMAENLHKVNAPVLIGVGAAFDFISGNKPQAPLWIQRSGLEWLFRLISEPARLWKRYIRYPKFVILVLLQLIGLKKFPIEE